MRRDQLTPAKRPTPGSGVVYPGRAPQQPSGSVADAGDDWIVDFASECGAVVTRLNPLSIHKKR